MMWKQILAHTCLRVYILRRGLLHVAFLRPCDQSKAPANVTYSVYIGRFGTHNICMYLCTYNRQHEAGLRTQEAHATFTWSRWGLRLVLGDVTMESGTGGAGEQCDAVCTE